MDLEKFAEVYSKLYDKALEIMEIYGLGQYSLDGIEVDEFQGQKQLIIKTSIYYSGCGNESEWLTFNLEEMNNDIEYFKNKYQETIEKEKLAKELAKEKEVEDRRLSKEAKDEADYKRLKLKFENKL